MCEILTLVPYTEEEEIEKYINEIEQTYDDKVRNRVGRFFKEKTSKIEYGSIIETFTYYKDYLFVKREVAKYNVYYNKETNRATITNLKFI